MGPKILIVDDNIDYAEGVQKILALYDIRALTAANESDALRVSIDENPNIVFIDIRLGESNGVDLLKKLKKILYNSIFIMITAYGTIDTAIASLKLGASDYLRKPVDFESILKIVNSYAEDLNNPLDVNNLIRTSVSHPMKDLLKKTKLLAQTKLPILITGENGTGKELIANFIVAQSRNPKQPFIKVNSSAFPESLLDNELFGHEKGAYTGASSCYKGVFERANGGTLFLDEIGDMPLQIQPKILRAIQNNEIRRIGSEETKKINTRFIGATNKDIPSLIETGLFRKDLYYRLNTAEISIPPLRERKDDLIPIISTILTSLNIKDGIDRIDKEVIEFFFQYSWPGNIRELKNCLQYAAALSSDSNNITMEHIPANMTNSIDKWDNLSKLEQSEKETIKNALSISNYNKTKAASILSISRTTLYQKIDKYDL